MLNVLVTGTLVRDPQERQSAKGKAFVTASMRVPVEEGESILVSLIAFSDSAVSGLRALSNGDALAVSGRGKLTEWEKNGEQHRGMSVVAERVMTLYQLEKKRSKARGEVSQEGARDATNVPAAVGSDPSRPAPAKFVAGRGGDFATMEDDVPF
jgi:single-stranded DNA-binding protein